MASQVKQFAKVFFVSWVLSLTGTLLGQQSQLIPIAQAGSSAPGGGTFDSQFQHPVLNDSGQVAFYGEVDGVGQISFFDGDTLVQVVREGQPAPGGNGVFDLVEPTSNLDPNPFAINEHGQVAFFAQLENTAQGSEDNQGIFVWDGNSLAMVVQTGDLSPDGNGVFDDIEFGPLPISFNTAGEVAFQALLRETSGGFNDREGVFVGDGDSLTQFFRRGEMSPSGDGEYLQFEGAPVINEVGQVTSWVELTDFDTGGQVIVRSDGATTTEVVRSSNIIPGSDDVAVGQFTDRLSMNDHGEVAFKTGRGIFKSSGNGVSVIAYRDFTAVPGGGLINGTNPPFINNDGQVAFFATLTDSPSGDNGIFVGDGVVLDQVVREGQMAPETAYEIRIRQTVPWLNDNGHVAFAANFTDASSNVQALYFWMPDSPLAPIAAIGDQAFANPINNFDIYSNNHHDETNGFNNRGQFAFVAGTDSGDVVALWSPSIIGDVNGDGTIDLLDVGPFVDSLISGVFIAAADINGDGAVDLLDVGPFVDLLTNG